MASLLAKSGVDSSRSLDSTGSTVGIAIAREAYVRTFKNFILAASKKILCGSKGSGSSRRV